MGAFSDLGQCLPKVGVLGQDAKKTRVTAVSSDEGIYVANGQNGLKGAEGVWCGRLRPVSVRNNC